MSVATGTRRAEAIHLFEEFLDAQSAEEIDDLLAGRKMLTAITVDGRLSSIRNKPIEEAFNYLNGHTGDVLKGFIKGPAPVGKKKQDWIDFILQVHYGRTYLPPKPTRAPSQRANRSTASSMKAGKPAWNPAEIAAVLRRMTSVADGTSLLSPRENTIARLKELADVIGIKLEKKLRPEIIHEIVYATIAGPRTLDRAQNG